MKKTVNRRAKTDAGVRNIFGEVIRNLREKLGWGNDNNR